MEPFTLALLTPSQLQGIHLHFIFSPFVSTLGDGNITFGGYSSDIKTINAKIYTTAIRVTGGVVKVLVSMPISNANIYLSGGTIAFGQSVTLSSVNISMSAATFGVDGNVTITDRFVWGGIGTYITNYIGTIPVRLTYRENTKNY